MIKQLCIYVCVKSEIPNGREPRIVWVWVMRRADSLNPER